MIEIISSVFYFFNYSVSHHFYALFILSNSFHSMIKYILKLLYKKIWNQIIIKIFIYKYINSKMGDFLSVPNKDKESEDNENNDVFYKIKLYFLKILNRKSLINF